MSTTVCLLQRSNQIQNKKIKVSLFSAPELCGMKDGSEGIQCFSKKEALECSAKEPLADLDPHKVTTSESSPGISVDQIDLKLVALYPHTVVVG